MSIRVKVVGKAISLYIFGMHFYLNESELRHLRAEVNRALQRIAEKRKQNA